MADHSTRQLKWIVSLVADYESRLTRYAQRLTGDLDSARDVVQHTFLRLCDAMPESIEDIRSWLYTVCHHRAIDVRREAIRVVSLEGSSSGGSHDARPNVPGREIDPAVSAELKDVAQILERIVDLLPENQRQVINLWAEGFNYREISQITDRNDGYVRVLAHRGFQEMRRHPLAQRLMNDERGTINDKRTEKIIP
jgi:RNA polymerase sigma-70 factor (ECF subfamily)